jgi:hypothetical protein
MPAGDPGVDRGFAAVKDLAAARGEVQTLTTFQEESLLEAFYARPKGRSGPACPGWPHPGSDRRLDQAVLDRPAAWTSPPEDRPAAWTSPPGDRPAAWTSPPGDRPAQ